MLSRLSLGLRGIFIVASFCRGVKMNSLGKDNDNAACIDFKTCDKEPR